MTENTKNQFFRSKHFGIMFWRNPKALAAALVSAAERGLVGAAPPVLRSHGQFAT